jgi:hypothetical protein
MFFDNLNSYTLLRRQLYFELVSELQLERPIYPVLHFEATNVLIFFWVFNKHQIMSYIFNFLVEILLILTYDLGSVDQSMNDSRFYVVCVTDFVDSVMKLSTRNRPSSDTIYVGTVIIPYVNGISEKFRSTENRFNLRTIFKTKHTFRGTLMKTGPVRDAQQTKQCMYNIPCDCGRCYIGETNRSSEVRIKEHKYNLTQSLFDLINNVLFSEQWPQLKYVTSICVTVISLPSMFWLIWLTES